MSSPDHDPVVSPSHYNAGGIETIDAIWATGHGEGFCVGNAIKYLSRAGKKDGTSRQQDLEKAAFYVAYLLHKADPDKHKDPRGYLAPLSESGLTITVS